MKEEVGRKYCIAGNFGGVKFWRITNFSVIGRF